MPDIFLSYSREDQATARLVIQALEREGFSVWWDQALNAGEAFDKATEKALDEARAVVVLWSKRSVDSDWVRAEATQAHASKRLVPAMIEPCRRPIMFELTHTADLVGWNGDADDARWRAFVGSLQRLTGGSGVSSPRTESGATPAQGYVTLVRSVSRRNWIAGSAVALVLVALAATWLLRDGTPTKSDAAGVQQSIAVLPFDDMSPAKDQAYFADGVSEEILNQLARIDPQQLRVIARNSSFAVRGKAVSEVAQMLDVNHVLEGSIRRDGDQLRITAQLINTRTDAHLWSKTFDRPATGVFAVQEEIARSVASALQVSLGVGIGRQPGMTRDLEAYDLYLQALSHSVQFTPDTWRRAASLLEASTRKDPGFAMAWLSLSTNYARMPTFASGEEAEWTRKADEALEKFRQLMPESPNYYQALMLRSALQGRTREVLLHAGEARAAAERMGLPELPRIPAPALLAFGRVRDAIISLEQLKSRDPLAGDFAFWLAHSLEASGDSSAAYAEVARGYALGGPWQQLITTAGVMAALGARDRQQLIHWLQASISTAPDPASRQIQTERLELLDKPAEALAALRTAASSPSASPILLVSIAPWQAYYGDHEGALKTLQAARRVSQGESFFWSSVYRDMRKLPAFKQQLRDEGWLELWRETGNWGDFCKPTTGDDFECR